MTRDRLLAVALAAALLAALLAAAGCARQSPEERIAALRARYTAEVNQGGFLVHQEPVAPAVPSPGPLGEAEGEAARPGIDAGLDAGAPAEGAAGPGEVPSPARVRSDVTLDILLRNESPEPLPGITLDVSMVGSTGQEKGHWLVWVDTSGLLKGAIQQVSHTLEDIDFEEGDSFSVEVRHPVPPAERSEYREFERRAG